MYRSKLKWKRKIDLKKPFALLLLLYLAILSVNLLVNYPIYAAGGSWLFSISFSLSVTTIGWLGYMGLYYGLFKHRLNWHKYPSANLFLAVILSGVYGILLMVLSMKGLQLAGRGQAGFYDYVVNGMYAALFSMLLGLLINGQHFLQQWKKSAEANERMKTELLLSQHEALKNQVNPHFLFNALNTLISLVPEQPATAVQFIQSLSNIFRYSLQHHKEATVLLDIELKVATAFLFLHQQRFSGKMNVCIDIPDTVKQKHIVAHALLILLENVVKHNEISTQNPLSISITSEADYLVVSNTYQPKQQHQPSLGIGLSNVVERYKIITDQPVLIRNTALFTVKIPLLAW